MTEETANQLMGCITEVYQAVTECQIKLVALEKAMEKHDPALVELWSDEIASLRKLKTYQVDRLFLAELKSKLVQKP